MILTNDFDALERCEIQFRNKEVIALCITWFITFLTEYIVGTYPKYSDTKPTTTLLKSYQVHLAIDMSR